MRLAIHQSLLAVGIDAYSDSGAAKKDAFHKQGKAFMRKLAEALSLDKGTFDVRSNMGGIAVSGEITLHGESIYVQLDESCIHTGCSIMFRTCKGRDDCTGGSNNFIAVNDLLDDHRYSNFIERCKLLATKEVINKLPSGGIHV